MTAGRRLTTTQLPTLGWRTSLPRPVGRPTPTRWAARAASMIGRSGYDLFSNNCEHFATWCVTGEHSSAQVEMARSTASMVGVGNIAPRIGRSAVVGLGEAAPRSASNVMSGLTKLGGSAIGGVTVVAGASAVK